MSNNPNANNPMKKRFRAWQPSPDEPPRRRRYPRLVIRDRTGNHIANDISTAPKVELQKQPIAPSSIPVPTSAVSNHNDDDQEVTINQGSPSRVEPSTMNSLVCSATIQESGARMHNRPSQLPPTSPPHADPTPGNNPETLLRSFSRDADYRTLSQPTIHKQERLQTSVPPSRVNTLPIQAQSQHLSPRYTQRQRTTPGSFPTYDASPCTPTPSVGPMASASYAQRSVSYAAQPFSKLTPRQPDQYESFGAHNSPQRPGMYQAQDVQYGTHETGPQPPRTLPPLVSHTLGGPAPAEKVILAGKRCGTVEYWRSSLQMPREKGVVKSLKAPAPQSKRRGKQGKPERIDIDQSINATPPPISTSAPMRNSPGLVTGYASTYASAYNSQRRDNNTDYGGQSRPGQSPRPLGQNPRPLGQSPRPLSLSPRPLSQSPRRPESDIEHEFWRTATKLPRASAESTRVKKLANGRRRIDNSAIAYLDDPREAGGARPVHGATVAGSPISGRQYSGAQHAGPVNGGMQPDYTAQSSSAPGGQGSGIPILTGHNTQTSRHQTAVRTCGYSTPRDRITRAKAESEKRRLLFLRDFELRRLRTLAQSKFHVKMNLRGRMKLEQWVCSDSVTFAASELIVIMFNLDRRVLSKNDDIRRNALYDMTNEDLRILEALMCRLRSRGGRTNWELLTSSLSLDSFIGTLPAPETT